MPLQTIEDHSGGNIHAEAGGYVQKEVHVGAGVVICREKAMQNRYSSMNGGQWGPLQKDCTLWEGSNCSSL